MKNRNQYQPESPFIHTKRSNNQTSIEEIARAVPKHEKTIQIDMMSPVESLYLVHPNCYGTGIYVVAIDPMN